MADQPKSAAIQFALIYLAAGAAWMAFCLFVIPPATAWGWMGRGLLWLLGSALLWFPLIHRPYRAVLQREAQLRQAEAAVRANEAQSRAILENAADGIIAADARGVIHLFNPAAALIFGYASTELIGQNIKMLIPRPYLPEHDTYHLTRAGADSPATTTGREVVGRRKSGQAFPVELAVSAVREGADKLYIAVMRDITERKRAEEELRHSREQLRSLADRLQSIREEERTRISREIHDELGQSLTGVKMDLSWIQHRCAEVSEACSRRLQSMGMLIDRTIQTVRKIATELRPGILDNLGLAAALDWQSDDFAARTGIACMCRTEAKVEDLDPALGTALFRIYQETLTNVARHARATRVEVTLHETSDRLHLRVVDNGVGITPEALAGARSLGLLGMRERASRLGGVVQISGRRGQGTHVEVTLPKTSQPAPASAPALAASPSHD